MISKSFIFPLIFICFIFNSLCNTNQLVNCQQSQQNNIFTSNQDSIEAKQKNVLEHGPAFAECISWVQRVQFLLIFVFWGKVLIFLILMLTDCVISYEWIDLSYNIFFAISMLFDVVKVVFSSYHDCNFYWNMERNFLKEEIIHNYTYYNVFQEQKNHSGCEYDDCQKVDENNNSIQIKQRWRGQKILRKRIGTIIHDIIRTPNPFNHVYNLFNAVSINQRSLRDNRHDQSYFSSIFYVNKVEKVQIRKNAIIVFLQNIQQKNIPVQYFLQRLQSFGDKQFLILAQNIRRASRQFTKVGWKQIKQQYSGEPLSRFIQSMQGRAYACKVAPNKLVISRALIEILEQDLQLFALKISKYGFPKEIISAENYREVLNQAMINLEMASKYAMDCCELQELVSSTGIVFDDYVYAKGKKVKGRFQYWMPTPIINCVEFKGKIGEYEWDGSRGHVDEDRKNKIEEAVQIVRMREAETLQHLTTVSSSSLRRNKERVAGYRSKQVSQ